MRHYSIFLDGEFDYDKVSRGTPLSQKNQDPLWDPWEDSVLIDPDDVTSAQMEYMKAIKAISKALGLSPREDVAQTNMKYEF